MHYKLTLNSMLQQVLYHQRGQSWRRLIVTMCRMMVIYFQQCISVLMQFYHPTHTYGCLKHYLIFLITAMSKSQEKKKKERDRERERDVCLFYIMLSFKCIGVGKTSIPFRDSLDQVFLFTSVCYSKTYSRKITGNQYLSASILQKLTVFSKKQ